MTPSIPSEMPKRRRHAVVFTQKSLTKQDGSQQADVNYIVKRYLETGEPIPQNEPVYGDVSQVPDYQTLLNTVNYAREAFMELPAALRTAFNNDPAQLLDWAVQPQNQEQAQKLGILPSTNQNTQNTTVQTPPKYDKIDSEVSPVKKQSLGSSNS